MNIKNKYARYLALMVVMVLGLSFFTFAPVASADPAISLVAASSSEYKVYEGGTYDVEVDLTGYIDDTTVDFYVKGPLGEVSETEELIDSYEYITNGQHTFSWDGQFSGFYPSPGDYEFRLEGVDIFANHTNTITQEFAVTEESNISNVDASSVYYTTSSSDYEIDFHLDTAVPACLVFRIGGQFIGVIGPKNTGDYTAYWDGQFSNVDAPADDYDWRMFADSIYCGSANTGDLATGSVVVSNAAEPSPVLSDLSVDPDPYDPDDGNVTLGYTLSGSAGFTTINAEVYKSSDPGTAMESWSFTNQGNGSNSLIWDGTDMSDQQVPDGSYIFRVWGKDGFTDVVSEQVSFVVAKAAPGPAPGDECGGYSDVDADHPDCDAIEYVQSIGAMTGNPDGTFAPNDNLQRDQIAKISLETFDLFDGGEDYCDGNDPFPDVPVAQWSYQYICRGVALGMITGYLGGADAGYYRPARSVNRVEFLALILRNLSDTMPSVNSTSYNDVPSGEWYSGYAKYSYDNSLFTGNNLYPIQFTTRLEVAKVIYKLHQLGKI